VEQEAGDVINFVEREAEDIKKGVEKKGNNFPN